PSFIIPLPSFSVPSQTADPVRVAIVFVSFRLFQLRFALADAGARNQFWPLPTHAASGSAISPTDGASSRFVWAFANMRCLRPSQTPSAHQQATTGTAM